jgi:hypothetical protein
MQPPLGSPPAAPDKSRRRMEGRSRHGNLQAPRLRVREVRGRRLAPSRRPASATLAADSRNTVGGAPSRAGDPDWADRRAQLLTGNGQQASVEFAPREGSSGPRDARGRGDRAVVTSPLLFDEYARSFWREGPCRSVVPGAESRGTIHVMPRRGKPLGFGHTSNEKYP